jgi:hypothetical protein
MLTDQELQTLRNMGNEAEAAADEIVSLRAELAREDARRRFSAMTPAQRDRILCEREAS